MTPDVVKQIRRATRRRFTAEEKIHIVLEGLRGEIPVTELCRKEGIQPSIYYKGSKAFLDSGKNGLTRETQRNATCGEVRRLKEENEALKKAVAETVVENQKLKKVWACKAKEVSEDAQRAQAGSFKDSGGLRVAGPGGAGSTRDPPARPTIAGDTTSERGGWQACGTVPQDQDGFGIRSCPKNGTESWRWRCCFQSGLHEK